MPATVLIKRVTGASGSQTLNDITTGTTRLNTADVVADGTNNPTAIPTSGTNYSFWACIRLICSVAPATAINNIRFYSDGANGLGPDVDCKVGTVTGANGNTTTGYVRATGTAGLTGLQLITGNYAGISATASVFTYTAGAPLTVNGTFTTGVDTASITSTGAFGDWVVLQLTVGPSAVAGITAAETLTYIYDEF